MSIPFFRYPHLFAQQREEILKVMTAVMDRGAFILQSDLVEFEIVPVVSSADTRETVEKLL